MSVSIDAFCDSEELSFIPESCLASASQQDPLWQQNASGIPEEILKAFELVVDASSPLTETEDVTPKWIPAGKLSKLNVEQLLVSGTAAPFGRGTETVLDETVRKALHLKKDRYRIIFSTKHATRKDTEVDLATRTDASDVYVQAVRQALNVPDAFELRLQKVHIYDVGGFFNPHKDTPVAKNHLATIVHILPTSFKGGNLRISSSTEVVKIGKGGLAIFPADVMHEVQPVTKGVRVSIQLDVFLKDGCQIPCPSIAAPWISFVQKLMTAYVNNTCLAVELTHSYPLGAADPEEVAVGSVALKPADQGLMDAFLAHPHCRGVALFKTIHLWDTKTDEECSYPNYGPCEFTSDLFEIEVPTAMMERFGVEEPESIPFVMGEDFRDREPYDSREEDTGNEGVDLFLEYRSMCLFVAIDTRTAESTKASKKKK